MGRVGVQLLSLRYGWHVSAAHYRANNRRPVWNAGTVFISQLRNLLTHTVHHVKRCHEVIAISRLHVGCILFMTRKWVKCENLRKILTPISKDTGSFVVISRVAYCNSVLASARTTVQNFRTLQRVWSESNRKFTEKMTIIGNGHVGIWARYAQHVCVVTGQVEFRLNRMIREQPVLICQLQLLSK